MSLNQIKTWQQTNMLTKSVFKRLLHHDISGADGDDTFHYCPLNAVYLSHELCFLTNFDMKSKTSLLKKQHVLVRCVLKRGSWFDLVWAGPQ